MIAGFEEPTAGDIYFGERRVNDDPPNVRDAAMVFQSYAIFPHLDVFENVAFGLSLKTVGATARSTERVDEVLDLAGPDGAGHGRPGQLSGGQQQRVALARCIVMEPPLLLFDEPLSNLDAKLREQMRVEIRDLQQRLGITSIYVTHDQVEAMSMSDELVIDERGRVEQVGSPREVYARPANRFVADFIGRVSFVQARLDAGGADVGGVHWPLAEPPALPDGAAMTLVLRPEALLVDPPGPALEGTVRRVQFLGSHAQYTVDVDGVGDLQVDVPNPAVVGLRQVGARMRLAPVPGALHALPADDA